MSNKKIALLSAIFMLSSFFYASGAKAVVCQLCAIAVTSGLGLCRWFGIDDTVTGLWIGAIIVITIIWTVGWLDRKNIRFKFRKILVMLSYYLAIFLPLYFAKLIGHPYNKIYGIDKLVFATLVGSIAFFSGVKLNDYLKRKNDNKAYIPFQKVVIPIIPLIILSVIFYYLTCNK